MRFEAASDGFDFGEFGHGGGLSLIAAWLLQERREPQPAESGVDLRRVVDDAADQAVFLGLWRAHPEIAFGLAAHGLDLLAGLACADFAAALRIVIGAGRDRGFQWLLISDVYS